MPNLNDLSVAAAFSEAAYSSLIPFVSASNRLEALGQTGWTIQDFGLPSYIPPGTSVTGERPGIDGRGYYVSGNAAAFAAVKGDTLVLAFRGSDDAYLGQFSDDFSDAIHRPLRYYNDLRDYIARVLLYADLESNGIKKVIVTGHSLGGAMAEIFGSDFQTPDGRRYSADANFLGLDQSAVELITFGSPGLPPDTAETSFFETAWSSRLSNIGHTGDPIFQGTRGVPGLGDLTAHARAGRDIDVDLINLEPRSGFGAQIGDVSPFSSSLIFGALGVTEHKVQNYGVTTGVIAFSRFGQEGFNADDVAIGDNSNNVVYTGGTFHESGFLLGLGGADTLIGKGGSDYLDGGSGNDTLRGGQGADLLDGGAGVNTAEFDGPSSSYQVSFSGGIYRVEHLPSGETDTLRSIQQLLFSDRTDAIEKFLPSAPQPAPTPSGNPAPPSDDFGNSLATAALIHPGTNKLGGIQTKGDQDWFAVNLVAGQAYTFALLGQGSGGSSALVAPHLFLRDSWGALLNDGGTGSGSSNVFFEAQTTGVYYLQAKAHNDGGTGGYQLYVTRPSPTPPPDPDPEPAPTPSVGGIDLDEVESSVLEGDIVFVYRVEWRGEADSPVEIAWQVQGDGDHPTDAADFLATSGTVTLEPDDEYVYIRLNANRDQINEPDETFKLSISLASGSATIVDDDAWGTILDDDDGGQIDPSLDDHVNTPVGATTFAAEGEWTRGFVNTPVDVDYFAINLAAGATYRFNVAGDDDTSRIDGTETGFAPLRSPHVQLFDSAHNLIGTFSDSVQRYGVEYEFASSAAGTYYVSVREDGNDDIGQYFVNARTWVDVDDYTGDTGATGHLTSGDHQRGNLERYGDDDWFKVALKEGETYTFFGFKPLNRDTWTGEQGYIWPVHGSFADVKLYDAGGNFVASPSTSQPVSHVKNVVQFTAPTSGDYFLSVYDPSGVTVEGPGNGDYIVGFDHIPSAPAGSPIVVQGGPESVTDAWFSDVRNASLASTDGDLLGVGGNGSGSASAIKFEVSGLPGEASYAAIELYLPGTASGAAPGTMLLGTPTQPWGEGSSLSTLADYDLQTWLPSPSGLGWYSIDITGLYNQWQAGTLDNNGVILLPVGQSVPQNQFYSSDYSASPALRPRLVVYERQPERVIGTSDPDSLFGTNRQDEIFGLQGPDALNGYGEDDYLDGGSGSDLINGGDGIDLVSYTHSPGGVQINLAENDNRGSWAEGDSIINVEHVFGSVFNDKLIGSVVADDLIGDKGADILSGLGGNDHLIGGEGDDTYRFAPGYNSDTIFGFIPGPNSGDRLDLSGFGNLTVAQLLARASQIGANTVFDFGNGDTLTLLNVSKTSLTPLDLGLRVPPPSDFNADGKSDILWRHDNGTVAIWQMDGFRRLAGQNIGVANPEWQIEDTGDFNADGKSDILWRHDNGTVAIWQMDGFRRLAGQNMGVANPAWQIEDTGDFNADGKSDILWRHDNGTVAIWQMDGFRRLAGQNIGVANPAWQIEDTGDFNADGKGDILWRHDDGSVVIWQMDGFRRVAGQNVGVANPAWQIEDTGDFNADGRSDILWRHDNGTVAIWQMDGFRRVAGQNVGVANPAWHIDDTGDFNADGKSDILWRHDDGSVMIWQMDGFVRLADQPLGVTGTQWDIV